ncbi:hypothetical protein V1273_003038 [Bradyrhizobium sp. AZCC 1721]
MALTSIRAWIALCGAFNRFIDILQCDIEQDAAGSS